MTPAAMISTAVANDIANAAFKAGWHARDHEVAALQLECSRLWLAAFGERERRDFLLDRLDQIAAITDVDKALDEVFAAYCDSLVTVREAVTG